MKKKIVKFNNGVFRIQSGGGFFTWPQYLDRTDDHWWLSLNHRNAFASLEEAEDRWKRYLNETTCSEVKDL